MKQFTQSGPRLAAAAAAVLFTVGAAAFPASAAAAVDVSNTSAVMDHANILSDETEDLITSLSTQLSDACGAQIGVYTMDELLGNSTMEGYAYEVFNAWGLGDDDQDNGVLLLLAPNEPDGGEYYVTRGAGLETQLSISTLSTILDEDMEPDWAAGNYDAGTQKTVQALADRLCSIYGVTLTSDTQSGSAGSSGTGGGVNIMGWILGIIAVFLVIWLLTSLFRPRGFWFFGPRRAPRPPRRTRRPPPPRGGFDDGPRGGFDDRPRGGYNDRPRGGGYGGPRSSGPRGGGGSFGRSSRPSGGGARPSGGSSFRAGGGSSRGGGVGRHR